MNDSGLTELHLGAYHQDPEWVRNCIDAGFDVNKKSNNGYTALIWAIDMFCTSQDGDTEKIIDMLLDAGADPKHNPTLYPSVLEFALDVHPAIHEILVKKGVFV